MRKILIIFILTISFTHLNALENKILFKINNEIITTLDIYNQINYLNILNPDIKKLDKNKIIEISKNSLIREKVKKIAILQIVDEIKVSDEYLKNILTKMAKKNGFQSISEYEKYLKQNKVQISELKKKIEIDAIWNEIIFKKFNSKIVINKEKIFNQVVKNPDKKLLLSEILFQSSNESQMKIKYQKIQADIKKEGFKNAALIHSISNSSTVGGEIGWFDKNSLNELIKKNISNLKIGDYSKPILTAGGFLIIKIEDIKDNDIQASDIDNKVNALIRAKTNQQLNQYSNIYYNKIKKDLVINEF
jgi:peptidyl-prolyl cis-trans isomerase SurA